MKKPFLSTIIFFITIFTAAAQDSLVTAVSRNWYANLDFGVGYLHRDLGNINSFLSDNGYKPLSGDIITLHLAPSFTWNRFVLRAEYTFQFPAIRNQPGNVRTMFGGQHISAAAGYVILQKPGFRLYPYIGIVSFSNQLVVRERSTVTNVDDLVNHEQRGFHLAYSNAALDVGIQFDKLIPLKNRRWDCPQNTRYLTLGLRAGYIVSPAVKGRFNGNIVEGAPSWSPGGPYLKLVIGFSTKMRDLKWKK